MQLIPQLMCYSGSLGSAETSALSLSVATCNNIFFFLSRRSLCATVANSPIHFAHYELHGSKLSLKPVSCPGRWTRPCTASVASHQVLSLILTELACTLKATWERAGSSHVLLHEYRRSAAVAIASCNSKGFYGLTEEQHEPTLIN